MHKPLRVPAQPNIGSLMLHTTLYLQYIRDEGPGPSARMHSEVLEQIVVMLPIVEFGAYLVAPLPRHDPSVRITR